MTSQPSVPEQSECPKCGHVHLGPIMNYDRRCTKCDNCWLSILDYPEATGHGNEDHYLPVVDHPAHYGGDTTYEAIKVIEAWGLGFNLGNVLKYICRSESKSTRLENLEKAKWYLDREVQKSRDH